MKNQMFGSDQGRLILARLSVIDTIALATLFSEAGVDLVSEAWGEPCRTEPTLMMQMLSRCCPGTMALLGLAAMEDKKTWIMRKVGRARSSA